MFKKIGYIIVFLLLFIVSGCDESEDFKGAGASSISYPLNTSPLMTDQALGIDDPTGTWAINRFSFADVFTLYLTQDFIFTGAIDTTNATSNDSGPIALTPSATLVSAVDGKIFPFTGLAGFLSNSVLTMYDDATPVYYIGIKTPPTTTGETIGFNQATGDWDIVTPSGGSGITEIATDPTVNDLTQGQAVTSQASGDMFFRSITDRLYTYTGSAVLNYLVTISPVPTDGNNIVSTDGFMDCGTGIVCEYLYPVSSVPEFTANIGAGQQFDNWVGDATDTSTTTNPDTMTVDSAKTFGGAFSSTLAAISQYRFEDGALTTDTVGTNTLTNNAAAISDLVNFKEGLASTLLTSASSQWFSRTDTLLSSDFPLKSGTSNTDFTIALWYRPAAGFQDTGLVTKFNANAVSERSFAVLHRADGQVYLAQGYNSGASFELSPDTDGLVDTQWYHIAVTYEDTGRAYKVRIWDDNGSVNFTNLTGVFANSISLTSADFLVGALDNGNSAFVNGNIDNVQIFDSVLSDAQIDALR